MTIRMSAGKASYHSEAEQKTNLYDEEARVDDVLTKLPGAYGHSGHRKYNPRSMRND